jgi:hypothetical protein
MQGLYPEGFDNKGDLKMRDSKARMARENGVAAALTLAGLAVAFFAPLPHRTERQVAVETFFMKSFNLFHQEATAATPMPVQVEWAGNIRPHPVRSAGDENTSSQIARLYVGNGTQP